MKIRNKNVLFKKDVVIFRLYISLSDLENGLIKSYIYNLDESECWFVERTAFLKIIILMEHVLIERCSMKRMMTKLYLSYFSRCKDKWISLKLLICLNFTYYLCLFGTSNLHYGIKQFRVCNRYNIESVIFFLSLEFVLVIFSTHSSESFLLKP